MPAFYSSTFAGMYSTVQLAVKYISWYFAASNGKGHGVHSPFVFDFITKVLTDNRSFYAYKQVEDVRKSLLSSDKVLQIEDFGAGSTVTKSNRRKVSDIARSALKPKKYGQLMFRMINYYGANTTIELGTSLGITTSYLASGNLKGKIYTFEGATEVAEVAKQNFTKLSLQNVEVIEGNFDLTLQKQLDKIGTIDFAFVDGNHREKPTLLYFKQLLTNCVESSILVFDDIHWSQEMEQAWSSIKNHPEVTLTIDLFFIGIVFFRKEQKFKEHFSIRF